MESLQPWRVSIMIGLGLLTTLSITGCQSEAEILEEKTKKLSDEGKFEKASNLIAKKLESAERESLTSAEIQSLSSHRNEILTRWAKELADNGNYLDAVSTIRKGSWEPKLPDSHEQRLREWAQATVTSKRKPEQKRDILNAILDILPKNSKIQTFRIQIEEQNENWSELASLWKRQDVSAGLKEKIADEFKSQCKQAARNLDETKTIEDLESIKNTCKKTKKLDSSLKAFSNVNDILNERIPKRRDAIKSSFSYRQRRAFDRCNNTRSKVDYWYKKLKRAARNRNRRKVSKYRRRMQKALQPYREAIVDAAEIMEEANSKVSPNKLRQLSREYTRRCASKGRWP